MTKRLDFDVFLAHNSRDKPMVRQFARALEERGLRPWLDENELIPGRSWQESLEEAVSGVRSIAVFIGSDGLGPWQELELEAILREAVGGGVPVIPVLLPGAPAIPQLPIFLRNRTWVDLRNGLSKESIDRLQWGITGERPVVGAVERNVKPIDLFLCFLNDDRRRVQEVAKQLDHNGIRSWPDNWDLSPQESWRQLLSHNVQRISALGVFAGEEGGPWVDDQVESFIWELIEANKLVIPVILPTARRDPKFPVYLRRKVIVDFRKSDPNPISLLASLLSADKKEGNGSRNG